VRENQDEIIHNQDFRRAVRPIVRQLGKRIRAPSPVKRLLRHRSATNSPPLSTKGSPCLGPSTKPRSPQVRPSTASGSKIGWNLHLLEGSQGSSSKEPRERRRTLGSLDLGDPAIQSTATSPSGRPVNFQGGSRGRSREEKEEKEDTEEDEKGKGKGKGRRRV
jgi:hypothetical protein